MIRKQRTPFTQGRRHPHQKLSRRTSGPDFCERFMPFRAAADARSEHATADI